MHQKIIEIISRDVGIQIHQVINTLELLNEKATVLLFSRYRKERTGGLDEVEYSKLKSLQKSSWSLKSGKETVLNSIEEQEKLTPELKARIENCYDATELEGYLPAL